MSDVPISFDASLCPLCGKTNVCAMELEKSTGVKQAACWCVGVDFSAELLARLPTEAKGRACICAACAAGERAARR
jgi:hypothetical protein